LRNYIRRIRMPDVGVRDLKIRASEIVRAVRERRARYTITYRGRPVGVLLPLEEASAADALPDDESGRMVWDELTEIGEEIGRGWRSDMTSFELLSQMRR
jgi:prevent-host-death family protein